MYITLEFIETRKYKWQRRLLHWWARRLLESGMAVNPEGTYLIK